MSHRLCPQPEVGDSVGMGERAVKDFRGSLPLVEHGLFSARTSPPPQYHQSGNGV